jgi:uncharacterized repeat protein (TIGR02543 family)
MTVNGVYEGNTVKALLQDIEFYKFPEIHFAVILKDGVEVTDGYLEAGMVVQIYHGRRLYGEYKINELLETPSSTNNSLMSTLSFRLPICGLTSSNYGCGWGCTCTSLHGSSHQGIDIARGGIYGGGIYGTPIRAVEAGTVVEVASEPTATSGWGSYVIIRHNDNTTRTVYTHMRETILISVDQQIPRGHIIGHIGNTGASTGPHLHFELIVGGHKVNPRRTSPSPTLNGAASHTNASTFRVNLHSNRGIFNGFPKESDVLRVQNKTRGVSMPIADSLYMSRDALTRTGHTLVGWSTNPNAETTTLHPGANYNTDTTNASVDLHAMWINNNNRPTITFNRNFTGAPANTTATVGTNGRLTASQIPTPTRTGYTFVGWFNTSATSGGTQLTANVAHTLNNTTPTYWARWRPVITYNLNGTNTTPTSIPQTTTDSNGRLTASQLPTITRTGYIFNGWWNSPSGQGTQITTTYTFNTPSTIWARWLLPIADGWYHIRAHGGSSVHIEENISAAGQRLVLFQGHGANNTKFFFEHIARGEYRIRSGITNSPQLYADLFGPSTLDSADIGLWTWNTGGGNNNNNQLWILSRHGDRFVIVNRFSNKALNAPVNAMNEPLRQRSVGAPPVNTQLFELIPTTAP